MLADEIHDRRGILTKIEHEKLDISVVILLANVPPKHRFVLPGHVTGDATEIAAIAVTAKDTKSPPDARGPRITPAAPAP
jgi:hypothetical protein